VIDRTAIARIQRLMRWLESFQRCFGHRAQRLALRTYVQGVFSDSDRKSMQAMLARVTEPVSYQAFQHFITHAPWDADRIWRRLLEILPERRGVLIIDGTSFPKQGPHSVGVARQYCGALGKISNCQVAVTAALWTGTRAWLLGALLYLPQSWIEDADRRSAALYLLTLVGWYGEAMARADAVVAQVHAAGVPSSIAWAYLAKGQAFADADPALAVAALDQGLDVARRSGNRLAELLIAIKLATLQARSGDTRVALERFDDLIPLWLTRLGVHAGAYRRRCCSNGSASLKRPRHCMVRCRRQLSEARSFSNSKRRTCDCARHWETRLRGDHGPRKGDAIDDAVEFARAGVVASLRKVGNTVSGASPSDR
jgi:hypothetical protein